MAAFPGRELLHRTEVEKWLGVSRSWIYAEMRAGRFPEPVKIGKRAVRWRVSYLEEWIKSRPTPVPGLPDEHNFCVQAKFKHFPRGKTQIKLNSAAF